MIEPADSIVVEADDFSVDELEGAPSRFPVFEEPTKG
jgi:hypothetical protein